MKFSDVIAQTSVKQQLQRQLAADRVPHALLFAGPAGTGKLPMALAMASALLCTARRDAEACGACPACRMTASLAHPDLHFVFPIVSKGSADAAVSDLYLKEWRQALTENPYIDYAGWLGELGTDHKQARIYAAESTQILRKLSVMSSQGGYKVMIVWQPELMDPKAANSLLKILEEPPRRTVFLLVSDRPERVLETIRSRTRRIDFPRLTEADVAQALRQRHALGDEDARMVARLCEGSYARALQELREDAERAEDFDLFVLLMRLCYRRDIKELHRWADSLAERGRERQKRFLDYAQRLVRENFVYNFRQPELNYESRREADFSVRFARFINERNVIGIMDELSLAARDIEGNVNARMVFFDFSLKMIVLLIQ